MGIQSWQRRRRFSAGVRSLGRRRRFRVVVGALSALSVLACSTAASDATPGPLPPPPKIGGCPIFPSTNAWNQPVNRLPVARNSHAVIDSIGGTTSIFASFGSGTYDGSLVGLPYVVMRTRGNKSMFSSVAFDYASSSDRGPYPIPAHIPIEGAPDHANSGDRHAIIVDLSTCRLYELYKLRWASTHWAAGSGAIWSLRSNALRPEGLTSADAAGLPILPGLARWAGDASTGVIRHALRFSAPHTDRSYVFPARHLASNDRSANLPPMGTRVRLKASVDISHLPPQARMVAEAMKTYGLVLADNGNPWHVFGAPSSHWSNDQLKALGTLHGSDFEVVDTSSLRAQMTGGN